MTVNHLAYAEQKADWFYSNDGWILKQPSDLFWGLDWLWGVLFSTLSLPPPPQVWFQIFGYQCNELETPS